jgi:putative hemolysin
LISSVLPVLLIIFALILANGFFNAAEIALIAARRGRLQQLADQGDHSARLALELTSDPNRLLATVQIGITLFGTLAATLAGDRLIEGFAEWLAETHLGFLSTYSQSISLTIVVTGITVISVLFGELVPKRLALRYATTLARLAARPMSYLAQVGRPIVWLMSRTSDLILKLLGSRHEHDESSIGLEDIEHLIRTGTKSGLLDPAEQHVALEALRLGERTVRDIMRPRVDIDALDIDTPPREVLGAVAMSGFSRVPVYEEDLDHILGFVYIKDVFRRHYLAVPIDVRKMLHPAIRVPDTMPVDRLLAQFQKQHAQMAIVLDETGATEGLVTLEDVVEELVGEIHDEHRRDDEQPIVQRDDGSWLIDGNVVVDDMIDKLELPTPENAPQRRFRTVAGLILAEEGRIPRIGDWIEWQGLRLEVVDMDGPRIDRVLVVPPRTEQKNSEPTATDGAPPEDKEQGKDERQHKDEGQRTKD